LDVQRLVGWSSLVIAPQQTKPGTIRPTADRFRAVKLGNAPAASVKKDTLVHKLK